MAPRGASRARNPWNKGKIVGQKAPRKLKDDWALRVPSQMANRIRELALLNLGIDSDIASLEEHGIREVASNLKNQWIWSGSTYPYDKDNAYVYIGSNGVIYNDAKRHRIVNSSARCVAASKLDPTSAAPQSKLGELLDAGGSKVDRSWSRICGELMQAIVSPHGRDERMAACVRPLAMLSRPTPGVGGARVRSRLFALRVERWS